MYFILLYRSFNNLDQEWKKAWKEWKKKTWTDKDKEKGHTACLSAIFINTKYNPTASSVVFLGHGHSTFGIFSLMGLLVYMWMKVMDVNALSEDGS